jgi:hypothetical protein
MSWGKCAEIDKNRKDDKNDKVANTESDVLVHSSATSNIGHRQNELSDTPKICEESQHI